MVKKNLLEIIKHPSGLNIIRTIIPEDVDKEKYVKFFSKELISNGFSVQGDSYVADRAYFFVEGLK